MSHLITDQEMTEIDMEYLQLRHAVRNYISQLLEQCIAIHAVILQDIPWSHIFSINHIVLY